MKFLNQEKRMKKQLIISRHILSGYFEAKGDRMFQSDRKSDNYFEA